MRNIFLVLTGFMLASVSASAQSCNCYMTYADSLYAHVPMTQGTDIGYPPYYHCNNCSSQPIKLPFNFCFYGKLYDTVFVNNKGNLTFVHPEFDYSNKKFPLGNDTLMLATYYTDINDTPQVILPPRSSADISYSLTSTHLIVQWSSMGYNVADDDTYDNFQITITNGADSILPAGNNVSYCYNLMQFATGDSGTPGFNATPSIVGVNKGDGVHYAQFGTFDYRGYSYFGPEDTTSQVFWLENKSLVFNTCVSGNNIPPVIVKSDSCLYDTVCAGDTLTFSTTFLCSQQGQKAVITVSSPGISGFVNDTLSRTSLYIVKSTLVPLLKDTGSHVITIIATDNNIPPLTDSISYTIVIKNCDSASAINKVSNGVVGFSIYPNPNHGIFTLMANGNGNVDSHELLTVFNIYGQQVFAEDITGNFTDRKIDLSTQPAGVYIYRITTVAGNLLSNGKFVIE